MSDVRDIDLIQRVTTLETQNKQFVQDVADIKKKLDELLELKSKGMGAFWLASAIMGTGIVGTFSIFIQWLKG